MAWSWKAIEEIDFGELFKTLTPKETARDTAIIIGAAGIMSGNQARRRQKQDALNGRVPHNRKPSGPSPLTPIQSSELYHEETSQLAQSISQYRYGAKMPGYMT